MSFDKAFRLSSYLLLMSGFAALFASEALGPLLAGLYTTVVILSWRVRPLDLSPGLQLILFLVFTLFFAVDAITLSDFVTATIHLLVLVSLAKLFTLQAARDYLILYLISFGFLLFSAAYTLSVSFLVVLVLYIFASILTFILFESKQAYEENQMAYFSFQGYANVAVVITLLIILISIPIFLVVPRVSLGLFRIDRRLDLHMSGFSDNVNLGDIGQIIANSSVVMRVRLDTEAENLPAAAKWRGIALDFYSGKGWSNTKIGFRRLREDAEYGGILLTQERRSDEFLVQQDILLEPFSNVIFGAPRMILVNGEVFPSSFVFDDGNDSIGIYRRVEGPLRYVVYSDLVSREQKLAMPLDGTTPEGIVTRYLQLPELNPSIPRLAQQVTEGFTNPVEKALALERFLKENYDYGLDNTSASADDPLYDFLMVGREGHCEYFATAQALMMRSLGIPSRVVNGFRRGEFNNISDYFVVRQSDAHSWVEGYFAGPGWIEFDATPALVTSRQELAMTRWFSQLLDAIDLFWTEVVTFDRVKQVGFFRSMRGGLSETWSRIYQMSRGVDRMVQAGWLKRVQGWDWSSLMDLALLALILPLLWLGYRYRRYLRLLWQQWFGMTTRGKGAPEYYLEMLDLLNRRGLVKGLCETPFEFVERVDHELSSPSPAFITELYYRQRFGNRSLSSADLANIYHWLRSLRSSRVVAMDK